jgi:hypothetical protein
MDWQTILRAAVPFGAALLAVVALVASRRDRDPQSSEPRPPAPAIDAEEPLGLERVARPPAQRLSQASPGPVPFPFIRAAAAGVLVLLAGATALVFVTSRPLADVEIATASMTLPPCPERQDCPDAPTLSLSGTLGGDAAADAVVYVLVKPASGSAWSVSAETRPAEVSIP